MILSFVRLQQGPTFVPGDARGKLLGGVCPQPETVMIKRLLAAGMIRLIRFYQLGISPLIGPNCRFTPSCSQYAIEVIRKDGPMRGTYRAIRRILRCHPWNPGGYDPP